MQLKPESCPSPFPIRFPQAPKVTRDMSNSQIMEILTNRTARYEDLRGVPIIDNGEGLVPVPDTVGLTYYQRSSGIYAATGMRVFLREGLVDKAVAAGRALNKEFPGHKIGILEGYRPLEQQIKEFEAAEAAIRESGKYKHEMDLKNQAHLRSAAPDVGGHVAGGAFDFEVLNPEGIPVRRGTAMSEWVDRSWTNHPDISDEAKFVRDTTARIFAEQDILIFEGEVWHAHYGDIEYAWLMNWDNAIYGPQNFTDSQRFSHLGYPNAIRFEECIGSTFGKPIHLPSDSNWELPLGLRTVNRKEPVGLQCVNLSSDDSPPMARQRKHI